MKALFKIISTIAILSICTSIFASDFGYRKITENQYVKWRKSTRLFIYAETMQCANLHNTILLYNDLTAHNFKSARNRFYAMQCSLHHGFSAVSIVRKYAQGRIALVIVDASVKLYDSGPIQHPYAKIKISTTYALSNQYVFTYTIHNVKELKDKFIEEK